MWGFLIVVAFLIGFGVGGVIFATRDRKETIGTLIVDETDPDGPYLFTELKVGPWEIAKHKQVLMDVQVNKDISQK